MDDLDGIWILPLDLIQGKPQDDGVENRCKMIDY